jgi:RNA polymerase sigma-70 factor (ECF subfamily)
LLPERQILESELFVIQFQRGNRLAFEGIVRCWERSLFYYLRRLAASEADTWDLLQETWMKVFRSIGSLRDPRALPAFLYTTARNTAISRMRGRKLESENSEPSPDQTQAQAECESGDIAAFDNAEQVHHALDQLPILQREALTLHFLHDLSMPEMSELLAVPVGTVKSRLFYAKLAMRKILLQGEAHVTHVRQTR